MVEEEEEEEEEEEARGSKLKELERGRSMSKNDFQ